MYVSAFHSMGRFNEFPHRFHSVLVGKALPEFNVESAVASFSDMGESRHDKPSLFVAVFILVERHMSYFTTT
jgi:hypothetical protein